MNGFKQMTPALWRELRLERLIQRDGKNCALCHKPLAIKVATHPLFTTFDHIIPRSKGGTRRLMNLQLAHRICNLRRGSGPEPDDVTWVREGFK